MSSSILLVCVSPRFVKPHAVMEQVNALVFFCVCDYLSCITQTHTRAERRARNIAGAEALAVARRPEVASREKNPAAAGIRRFFPLRILKVDFSRFDIPTQFASSVNMLSTECIFLYSAGLRVVSRVCG